MEDWDLSRLDSSLRYLARSQRGDRLDYGVDWDDWDAADWQTQLSQPESDSDFESDDAEYAPVEFDEVDRYDLTRVQASSPITNNESVPFSGKTLGKRPASSIVMPDGVILRGEPVEDASPRLVYNSDDGSVMVQTSGPAVTVDGLVGDLEFERITPEGESTLALWLDHQQADVLAKMIGYIIEKVSIKPDSKQLLADLLPEVQALVTRHEGG